MKVQYFGHSFWKVFTDSCSVVFDPFDNIGYPMPKGLSADYVIISHEHHDHNNPSLIGGHPQILRKAGLYSGAGMKAELISVFHDDSRGSQRGSNLISKVEMDNLTVVHCGDLGHIPSSEVTAKIMKPDLLFIPAGEIFTLPLEEVWSVIDTLQPRLLFPMHYGTEVVNFKLGSLDKFLKRATNIVRYDTNILEVTPELLAEPKTVIMNWRSKD